VRWGDGPHPTSFGKGLCSLNVAARCLCFELQGRKALCRSSRQRGCCWAGVRFAPLGSHLGSVGWVGRTKGLRGCCSAKPSRAGACPAPVGWAVGFCSRGLGMPNPAIRAACESEMGEKKSSFWLKRGYFMYRALYSGDLPGIFAIPAGVCRRLFGPWPCHGCFPLLLLCGSGAGRGCCCAGKGLPSTHTLPLHRLRALWVAAASAWGDGGTRSHLGASSPLPEDAPGWSTAGPCSPPKTVARRQTALLVLKSGIPGGKKKSQKSGQSPLRDVVGAGGSLATLARRCRPSGCSGSSGWRV